MAFRTFPTLSEQVKPVAVTSTELASGAAIAANQQTNALTDAQLRATVIPVSHYGLEVAKGNIPLTTSLQKFGRATNGIQITPTDVWSRADASATQQIWTAPTTARVHAIVSSSAADVSGSTGAISVIVYGLTSWTANEVSETVNLNGVTPVNTVNSYVIIHRIKCIAQASTTNVGVNVGTITATAATDATITALVLPSQGQTQMTIYGLPSTKTLYIYRLYAYMNDSAGATRVDVQLRVNENPNVQLHGFINKFDLQLYNSGNSAYDVRSEVNIPFKVSGPAIIKVQGVANAADIDMSAGFDGYLVETPP